MSPAGSKNTFIIICFRSSLQRFLSVASGSVVMFLERIRKGKSPLATNGSAESWILFPREFIRQAQNTLSESSSVVEWIKHPWLNLSVRSTSPLQTFHFQSLSSETYSDKILSSCDLSLSASSRISASRIAFSSFGMRPAAPICSSHPGGMLGLRSVDTCAWSNMPTCDFIQLLLL